MSVDKILFSLNGRINRQTFWVVMIPYIVIALLYKGAIDELSDFDDRTGSVPIWGWLVLLLVSISLTWIYFAAVIKRLHDRDKSAKWLILSVIPIIGWIWFIVELGCLRGTEGPNRFGLAPNNYSSRVST